jgi:hypothetical protein
VVNATPKEDIQMAAGEVLGNGNPDGTTVGRAATEKISVYGVTPVVQAATPAAAVSAASTTTVCNTAVLEIQTALKAFGIMASS